MKRVAIQNGLTNIESFLKNQGYYVDEYDTNKVHSNTFFDSYDAIVLTGMSTDMMGISDTVTFASVIDANGLTPEEVKAAIDRIPARS